MFVSIGLDDFRCEVIEESRPVLVAFIHWDSEFKEQVAALESISKTYWGKLKVCLLNNDSIGALREKFGIGGTPAFLILCGGKERDRMLGQADTKMLTAFILRTLPRLSKEKDNRMRLGLSSLSGARKKSFDGNKRLQ